MRTFVVNTYALCLHTCPDARRFGSANSNYFKVMQPFLEERPRVLEGVSIIASRRHYSHVNALKCRRKQSTPYFAQSSGFIDLTPFFATRKTFDIHPVRVGLQDVETLVVDRHVSRIIPVMKVEQQTYGVPFSHLFTELQISPIEVHISPIQLQISPNRPNWRYIQFNCRYLQFNCRYLKLICRYLKIDSIWRYLQLNWRHFQMNSRYLKIGSIWRYLPCIAT